jgi:hypothetical protein
VRKATDLSNVAALEEVVPPRVVITSSAAPTVFLRREAAGNDADGADPVNSGDEVERWARHAHAANGFGDAAIIDSAPPITDRAPDTPLTSYELYYAARAHRSFTLGEILVAMIQALGTMARRAVARDR